MRAFAFIVTFILVFGGVSAGEATGKLPNAGLFVFDSAPIAAGAPIIVASR